MPSSLALAGELVLQGPEYTCVLHAYHQRITLNVPHLKALQDIKKQVGLSSAHQQILAACLNQTELEFAIAVRHQPVLVMGIDAASQSALRQRINKWFGVPQNGRVFFRQILFFWKDLLK